MDFGLNFSDYGSFCDSFLVGSPQIQPDVAENSVQNHCDGLANEEPVANNKDSNNSAEDSSNGTNNYSCQDIVKGQWTTDEDKILIDLVKKHGEKWSKIAAEFKTRSGKQCRERWIYHYQPDIKENKWSEEEDTILIDAHREMGNKWSTICKRLPGRTDNAIKNYFYKTRRKNLAKRNSSKPKTALQQYIASLPEYNFPIARRTSSGEIRTNASTNTSCADPGVLPQDSSPNTTYSDCIDPPTFMHGLGDNNNNNNNPYLLQENNDPYRNELACVVDGFGGSSNNTLNPNTTASQINTNECFLWSNNYGNSAEFTYEEDPYKDELASLVAGFADGFCAPEYINDVVDRNPNSESGQLSDKKGKGKMPGYLL